MEGWGRAVKGWEGCVRVGKGMEGWGRAGKGREGCVRVGKVWAFKDP